MKYALSRTHDYHPSWDYVLVRPPAGWRNLVDEYARDLRRTLLPQFALFRTFRVYFADCKERMGRYIFGTYSEPVILLDPTQIKEAMGEYAVDLITTVRTTMLHELAHAVQEAIASPLGEQEAEDFTYLFYRGNGQIHEGLMRKVERWHDK